jgi:hypothetical protein
MSSFWRRRSARLPWLVGAFLAVSLTLVAPRSRIHHLAASLKAVRAHHLVSRRTLVDQGDKPDATIDRARREPPPDRTIEIASVPRFATVTVAMPIEPAQRRLLRRLRMAPAHPGGADPLS